jgi:DNA polymerase III sliding clamp (beta) subunit (PCNA family)
MVGSMVSEEIIFESNGPTAPGLFRDPKDSEYMHVIMPMRLE